MVEGEAGRLLTATAGGHGRKQSGHQTRGCSDRRGVTGEVTSAVADKARAGGRHGSETATRERVAGRQGDPDDYFYRV